MEYKISFKKILFHPHIIIIIKYILFFLNKIKYVLREEQKKKEKENILGD